MSYYIFCIVSFSPRVLPTFFHIHIITSPWKGIKFPGGTVVKNPSANAREKEMGVSLGLEDALEKEMAIHFSVLAWKIPWTEEPGRLQ